MKDSTSHCYAGAAISMTTVVVIMTIAEARAYAALHDAVKAGNAKEGGDAAEALCSAIRESDF